MRWAWVIGLVATACGPQFAVIPEGGLERVSAQAPQGVTMAALADQWQAEPADLADYLTPIAVELYNPCASEVRVSYYDFALKDDRGTRYPAINPFLPGLVGESDDWTKPVLLASRGGGFGGGGRGHSGGSMVRGGGGVHYGVGGLSGRRFTTGGWRGGGFGWPGFYVHGGLRGFYGPGLRYWSGPFLIPPFYRDWVLWWGPAYYPTIRPSEDVIDFALPEGVLGPGARVSGFLYFRKATGPEHRALDLSWQLTDARTGADLGSLHVPLQVVDR